MNRSRDDLLDRLVDGELSEGERRSLLARLGAEPDGWRRCALAFLEAQCWREALGAPPSAETKPRAAPVSGRSNAPRRVRSLAALAAGMLVAFVLGWAARGG